MQDALRSVGALETWCATRGKALRDELIAAVTGEYVSLPLDGVAFAPDNVYLRSVPCADAEWMPHPASFVVPARVMRAKALSLFDFVDTEEGRLYSALLKFFFKTIECSTQLGVDNRSDLQPPPMISQLFQCKDFVSGEYLRQIRSGALASQIASAVGAMRSEEGEVPERFETYSEEDLLEMHAWLKRATINDNQRDMTMVLEGKNVNKWRLMVTFLTADASDRLSTMDDVRGVLYTFLPNDVCASLQPLLSRRVDMDRQCQDIMQDHTAKYSKSQRATLLEDMKERETVVFTSSVRCLTSALNSRRVGQLLPVPTVQVQGHPVIPRDLVRQFVDWTCIRPHVEACGAHPSFFENPLQGGRWGFDWRYTTVELCDTSLLSLRTLSRCLTPLFLLQMCVQPLQSMHTLTLTDAVENCRAQVASGLSPSMFMGTIVGGAAAPPDDAIASSVHVKLADVAYPFVREARTLSAELARAPLTLVSLEMKRIVDAYNAYVETQTLRIFSWFEDPRADTSEALRGVYAYRIKQAERGDGFVFLQHPVAARCTDLFHSSITLDYFSLDSCMLYNTGSVSLLLFYGALCAFDKRLKMGMHVIMYGEAGLGKSWLHELLMRQCVPGMVKRITGISDASARQARGKEGVLDSQTTRAHDELPKGFLLHDPSTRGVRSGESSGTAVASTSTVALDTVIAMSMRQLVIERSEQVRRADSTVTWVKRKLSAWTLYSTHFNTNANTSYLHEALRSRCILVSGNDLPQRREATLVTYTGHSRTEREVEVMDVALEHFVRKSAGCAMYLTCSNAHVLPYPVASLFELALSKAQDALADVGIVLADSRLALKGISMYTTLCTSVAQHCAFNTPFGGALTRMQPDHDRCMRMVVDLKRSTDITLMRPFMAPNYHVAIYAVLKTLHFEIASPDASLLGLMGLSCGFTADALRRAVRAYDHDTWVAGLSHVVRVDAGTDAPPRQLPLAEGEVSLPRYKRSAAEQKMFYEYMNATAIMSPPTQEELDVCPREEVSPEFANWNRRQFMLCNHSVMYRDIAPFAREDPLRSPMKRQSDRIDTPRWLHVMDDRNQQVCVNMNWLVVGFGPDLASIARHVSNKLQGEVQSPNARRRTRAEITASTRVLTYENVLRAITVCMKQTRQVPLVPLVRQMNMGPTVVPGMFHPESLATYSKVSVDVMRVLTPNQYHASCLPDGANQRDSILVLCTARLLDTSSWRGAVVDALGLDNYDRRDVLLPFCVEGNPHVLAPAQLSAASRTRRLFSTPMHTSNVLAAVSQSWSSHVRTATAFAYANDTTTSRDQLVNAEKAAQAQFRNEWKCDTFGDDFWGAMRRMNNALYGVGDYSADDERQLRSLPALSGFDDATFAYFREQGVKMQRCSYPESFIAPIEEDDPSPAARSTSPPSAPPAVVRPAALVASRNESLVVQNSIANAVALN